MNGSKWRKDKGEQRSRPRRGSSVKVKIFWGVEVKQERYAKEAEEWL